MARSFHTSWNNSGEPRDSGRHFRLVPAEAGYVSVLLLLAPDRGQNPSSQFVGKNAAFGGYAHLLSQERLLKLADLIQSQTLTYVKAPFCSTTESLCKIVSLSFHKKEDSSWEMDRSSFRKFVLESRKELTRNKSDPAGDPACFCRQKTSSLVSRQCLLPVSDVKSEEFPKQHNVVFFCFFFFSPTSVSSCLLTFTWFIRKRWGYSKNLWMHRAHLLSAEGQGKEQTCSLWCERDGAERLRSLSELVAPAITVY